jgi:hypothetical protein
MNNTFHSDEDLRSHFLEKFGVNVKVEGRFYLFKYDQLGAKWSEEITFECRGVILYRHEWSAWQVMSRPFDKFFNRHEGHCPLFKESDFNSACPDLYMVEKADGTCIQVWYDSVEENRWRVSTLGTITTTNCGDSPWTFEELFWRTLENNYQESYNMIKNSQDTDWTLICELCTVENRILTRYPEDRVFYLGSRNVVSGKVSCTNSEHGLHMPVRHSFQSLGITSLEDAQVYVEKESKNTTLYGEYPEGMVIYDNEGPVCKMKNELYIQLHHAAGAGDTRCTRNKVIEAFFAGNMDDLYPVLVPSMQEFADKLKDWWNGKIGSLVEAARSFDGMVFEDARAYASHVHKNVPKDFTGYFFMNKVDAVDNCGIPYGVRLKDTDAESFASWMKKVHKKFEGEMKALSGI